ncbi:MAG: tRNA preQ1(34) S-adenosylmethionine ribosyltransferase-isomerase QueA [Oligoflexales bacterium]|nr:tRNA preQ1(34) S-adenosylmethionine ribosyltransferase-isomerase QueA [Oligoflexales bacterium]
MKEILDKSPDSNEFCQLALSDFCFQLPDSLVAQHPLADRHSARMLVRVEDGSFLEKKVHNLNDLLPREALVIWNDSKVFPSRLMGRTESHRICEIFLLGKPSAYEGGASLCRVLAKPNKHFKIGSKAYFEEGLIATFVDEQMGSRSVVFSRSPEQMDEWLHRFAFTPLPPYIQRENPLPGELSEDKQSYQTLYAKLEGSVAAPTAGLHFSSELMQSLQERDVLFRSVTLHVGAGTFLPVRTQNIESHQMHEERFFFPIETLREIEKAKLEGRTIVVVGTTALRVLESIHRMAVQQSRSIGSLTEQWLETTLFIHPQSKTDIYKPWACDVLMTNFHQPGSTLFMLICSLLGFDEAHRFYQKAIDLQMRFYSYGDSSLLWLKKSPSP